MPRRTKPAACSMDNRRRKPREHGHHHQRADPAKSCTVRVNAGDGKGDGAWTISTLTPPAAPSAIATVSINHDGDSLAASWDAPANAAAYTVEYRVADAASWISAAANHTCAVFTMSGIDAAKSSQVRVKARNDGGESAWTESAPVTRDSWTRSSSS